MNPLYIKLQNFKDEQAVHDYQMTEKTHSQQATCTFT
jgi:hypothetical protein